MGRSIGTTLMFGVVIFPNHCIVMRKDFMLNAHHTPLAGLMKVGKLITAVSMGALLLLASPAQAQSNAMVKACRSDALSLCTSVKPGGGRMAQCLQQHEAKLSPGCKAQLTTINECSQQVPQICGAEASTQSALRSCFAAHASEFSAACRSAVLSK
jgi:hypothetical protein